MLSRRLVCTMSDTMRSLVLPLPWVQDLFADAPGWVQDLFGGPSWVQDLFGDARIFLVRECILYFLLVAL